MKKIYVLSLMALTVSYFSFSQNNLRIITPVSTTPATNNTMVGVGSGNTTMTGAGNTMFGRSTGPANTSGYSNVFVGYQSGLLNTTGYENTIVGSAGAGAKLNIGARNVVVGASAGFNITNPVNNTMLGYAAGFSTTTGANNTFLGWGAGYGITTGQRNVIIGATASTSASSASYNVIIGNEAGYSNSTGEINVFIGNQAGKTNTNGANNTFIGNNAGLNNTSGSVNTFIGNWAGLSNTSAFFNTFIGSSAGRANTTGANNTFVGNESGYLNTIGTNNAFYGNFAGNKNSTGNFNTFIGDNAGNNNTTGGQNTFLGRYAGFNNSSASQNTFIGNLSGQGNTTGISNTFLGQNSGQANTTGSYNTFLGQNSGSANTVASNNTFVGNSSGLLNTGGFNSFFGHNTGQANTTGGFNTFVGQGAGFGNTTASYNTMVGQSSGQSITVGSNNTFLGANAGQYVTTSPNNVIIGVNAGQSALATGGSNTFIGFQADGTGGSASSLYNATAIGFNAKVGQNNSMVLGDNTVNVGIGTSTPQNKLEIASSTTNTSGLRLKNLTSTSPTSMSSSKVLSVDAFGDVILVPLSSGSSDTTTLSRLNFGTTNFRIDNSSVSEYASFLRFGDNSGKKLFIGRLKESAGGAFNSGSAGQLITFTDNGKVGIGTDTPQNNLEIASATNNTSGLRFNKLTSASPTETLNGKVLTVNASGDVILVPQNTNPSDTLTLSRLNFGSTNFRIDNSGATGYASYIRFGNNTGQKLFFGRLKESASGALNTGSTGQLITFTDNGKVGIGTDSPQNNLEIVSATNNTSGLRFNKLTSTSPAGATNGKVLSVDSNGDVILVTDESGSASGSDLELTGTNSWAFQTPDAGSTDLIITPKIGTAFSTTTNTTFKNNGDVFFKGNIGIGTTDTKGYKFAVAGNMVTEKVYVKKQANWPDFVFEDSYNLPSLQSIETFIKQNKHLPNIPSAKEVEANGQDLGDMNARLLQKIEEMTLYMIELKKEVETLKQQLNNSKK